MTFRRLSELDSVRRIQSGPFGTQLKATEYSQDGLPLISAGEIRAGIVEVGSETPRIPPTIVARLPHYVLDGRDVVFARKGAIERAAWVNPAMGPMFLGSDGLVVSFESESVARFYGLYFQLPAVKRWLHMHAAGSTMLSLSSKVLGDLPVRDFPPAKIRRINEVLGALDDKIAANRVTIKLVTELAASLVERAVSCEGFPASLGEVAEFLNRKRVPLSKAQRESRLGTIPYYGATSQMDSVDEAIFDENLVLVGEDGSVVGDDGAPVVQYIWGPSWVNNHAHVLRGTAVSTELLRLLLMRATVLHLVTGAVQPKLNMGNLKALTLEVPGSEQLEQLEQSVASLASAERAAFDENSALARARDELLPLLMSGRITVKDAERAAGSVL